MDITLKHINRLAHYLNKIETETYPEKPTVSHNTIIEIAVKHLLEKYMPKKGSLVLDVGCGQGPALELFRQANLNAVGITLNDEDVRICREKGFDTVKMDQSFLDFEENTFDVIWARHVIEHSIFPLFTLHEFSRVLKLGGILYLEVPAPETACHHERNPNHYSLFSKMVWKEMLARNSFMVIDEPVFNLEVPAGPDEYWGFYCCKNK